MMNKKVSMGLLISICALVCAVTFTLTMFVSVGLFDSKMNSTKAREAMYTRIAEVDSYVRENYVGEIDDEQLMNFLLKGYVNGIGDTYADGSFQRDGVALLTPLQEAQAQMAELDAAYVALEYDYVLLQLGLPA